MNLKLCCWNVEHSGRLASGNPNNLEEQRIRRIRQTFDEIDADIVCLVEGPKGEAAIKGFCTNVLEDNWRPILLPGAGDGTRDDAYRTKGKQWIWFLARDPWIARCTLQSPEIWTSFTGQATWDVFYWGQTTPRRHNHYRQPQVLRVDLGGQSIDLIGVHLKSKINKNQVSRDTQGNIVNPYLETALTARIKLATEARDVRRYIETRFEQSPSPGILVMGDCNDGPGQDWFEERYMFFDLVSNLQGNVMRADRFLNHALFDFPHHLRWSARYRDEVRGIPASQNPLLLDHILMSQPLVNGRLPLQANAHAGAVEHEAFDHGNAGASAKERTSDHRPVSVLLTPRRP